MSARSAKGENGFTLIELLVVILLLGFIALGIGGGIHFGTRVWEASEQRIAGDNDLARAQSILRALLASALPRKQAGFVTFEGTASQLTFDTEALPALGIAGLARIDISLVFFNGRKRLRLRVGPVADPAEMRETIMADDVGPVLFSFLDSTEAVPAWLASWRDRQRLPDAVRLAASGFGAPSSWSYFVARLPIAQTAGCAYDPLTYACRSDR